MQSVQLPCSEGNPRMAGTRWEYGITSSAGFCSSTEVVLVGRGAGVGTGPVEWVLWMAGCSCLVDSIILLDFFF